MPDDIMQRLKTTASTEGFYPSQFFDIAANAKEAAETITALRRERDALVEALKDVLPLTGVPLSGGQYYQETADRIKRASMVLASVNSPGEPTAPAPAPEPPLPPR